MDTVFKVVEVRAGDLNHTHVGMIARLPGELRPRGAGDSGLLGWVETDAPITLISHGRVKVVVRRHPDGHVDHVLKSDDMIKLVLPDQGSAANTWCASAEDVPDLVCELTNLRAQVRAAMDETRDTGPMGYSSSDYEDLWERLETVLGVGDQVSAGVLSASGGQEPSVGVIPSGSASLEEHDGTGQTLPVPVWRWVFETHLLTDRGDRPLQLVVLAGSESDADDALEQLVHQLWPAVDTLTYHLTGVEEVLR